MRNMRNIGTIVVWESDDHDSAIISIMEKINEFRASKNKK
jgi:hypothetical protein